jgi:predicted acylesterase/phospholipase RssA
LDKIGVAFSGGGGKGGYQVGVCRALQEFGIKPAAVSGTSVGALNGALFAQGRIEVAERIWLNIKTSDVLDLSLDRVLLQVAQSAATRFAETNPVTYLCSALARLKFKSRGLFSQDGLLSMMAQGFADQPLSSLTLPFWAAVHDGEDNKVAYLATCGRNEADARNLLLASAALPHIFDEISVDGRMYSDGGWFWELPHKILDNNPVTPLFEAQCPTVIMICLSRDDLFERSRFPHTRILPIVPSSDLGGALNGVMDFSADGAARRMELGYRDGKKLLSQLARLIENEADYEKMWQEVLHGEQSTRQSCDRMKSADTVRVDLKRSVRDFNSMVFEDNLEGELSVELPNQENLLEYANRLLVQRLERQEMLALNDKIKQFVDRNQDCSADLQRAALDAVSYLSPVLPQAEALSEQGVFGRFWNGLTGKNLKVIVQNQQDQAQAQFAALALLQQLQTRNLITLQFTAAVNNKLNVLFSELATLSEQMNLGTLDTYRSLALVWCKARREIMEDRKRINGLESRLDQVEWLVHIKTRVWMGVHYRQLPPVRQIVCVVNDFFAITRGKWTDKELITLETALNELGLLDRELSYSDFLEDSLKDPVLVRRLTRNLYRESPQAPDVPLLVTARALRSGSGALALPPTTWDAGRPPYFLALELLEALQDAGYQVQQGRELGAAKAELVKRLELLRKVAEQFSCQSALPELETLLEQVRTFRFTVPLVGPFSAGKSSLLNCYLEYDQGGGLLATNIDPTTAVATELHWTGGAEKVVERSFDGTERSYPLSGLQRHAEPPEHLFCREIHLNNQRLASHPDLILVDMPGLGSGKANHDQAIAAYVGRETTAFILCLPQESGTIKESERRFLSDSKLFDLELGLVINHRTDPDSGTIAEMTRQVCKYSGVRDLEVVALNACDGQMDDFSAMLSHLDQKKDAVLRKRIGPAAESMRQRLAAHLRYLLNVENLSAAELVRRGEKIAEAMRELGGAFDRERQSLLEDCGGSLPATVAGVVHGDLVREFQALYETAKKGGRIEDRVRGLAAASFQAALVDAARERFARTAQELQQYVASAGAADGAPGAQFDAADFPEISIGMGSIGIGTVLGWVVLGPLGGLIAGVVGFFMKSRQEEELKEKLHALLEEIGKKAHAEAARQLPQMAERFLAALKERLDGTLSQQKESIDQLEAQIAENRHQDEAQRAQIQEALRNLSARTN